MAWRVFVAALTLLLWAFVGWLASHHSPDPAVLGRYSVPYFIGLLTATTAALLVTLANGGPGRRWALRKRGKVALAVGSTLATLLLLEAAVRVFDPLGISCYGETMRYLLAMEPDQDLGYRHRPGLRDVFESVEVAIDDRGLRGPPVGPKAKGEYRILVLGDSVTFGWGVKEEDTFCRRLEALVAKGRTGPVRVVNSGVGGYNTRQEWDWFRLHGEDLAPDLVLLLFVHNDVERAEKPFDPWSRQSLSGKSPPEALHLILRESRVYRLLQHLIETAGEGPEVEDRAAPGWGDAMEAVKELADRLKERGIPLATFLYRREESPKYAALREDLGAIASTRGFAFFDVGPWFEGTTPREVVNSAVDVHPNARGHAILAEGIARSLRERGLLPN